MYVRLALFRGIMKLRLPVVCSLGAGATSTMKQAPASVMLFQTPGCTATCQTLLQQLLMWLKYGLLLLNLVTATCVGTPAACHAGTPYPRCVPRDEPYAGC